MTKTEKERISKLRAEGLSATRIAKQLGLSVNTVKSYLIGVSLQASLQ